MSLRHHIILSGGPSGAPLQHRILVADATADLPTDGILSGDIIIDKQTGNLRIGRTATTMSEPFASGVLQAASESVTLVGNQDNLAVTARTVYLDNATDITLRGIAAGVDGQLLTFVSRGAGNVFFAPQNNNSTAENRLVNFATVGNTPLAAGVGIATYRYEGGSVDRWKLVEHEQGVPITPTFAAGDYTGNNSMTWTVAGVTTMWYYLKGRVLHVAWNVATSTVGGTPSTQLLRAVPGGFTAAAASVANAIRNNDNGTARVGFAVVAGASIALFSDATLAANWAAGTSGSVGEIFFIVT